MRKDLGGFMFKNVLAFFIKHKALFAIVLLGLILRTYRITELFLYSHDQDLIGWFVKDIVVDHKWRLVGQETSLKGIFIGPLFYYALIPFYLLFKLDPAGGLVFSTLIGLGTILSFYFVFLKIFDKKVGLTASLIYAGSFYTVLTDREVVPTTPQMLFSVWFLYAIYLILNGKQKFGFILAGLLLGFIWNVNLALVLIAPLFLLSFFYSKKKMDFRALFYGVGVFIVASLPLIVFEIRHGFQQVFAIINTLSGGSGTGELSGFDRVIELVSKNLTSLLYGEIFPNPLAFDIFVSIFLFLVIKRILDKKMASILFLWIVIYIAFFTASSVVLSEYYLNGMTVAWIGILSVFLVYLSKNNCAIVYLLLGGFIGINYYRLVNIDINKSGYIERKQLVSEIKADAKLHGYPCVSVSYITLPGNNLGYRYLFWLENMHINKPDSLSPVYSIVFPHSMVDKIDKSFGALGLIYPDYKRYNEKDVALSCSGENSNLTDPMFGFTNK